MKSVRLERDLRARLRKAARAVGMTESAFIRDALVRRTEAVLSDRLDLRLVDVIGIGHGGGGQAERTGAAFTEIVRLKHAR